MTGGRSNGLIRKEFFLFGCFCGATQLGFEPAAIIILSARSLDFIL